MCFIYVVFLKTSQTILQVFFVTGGKVSLKKCPATILPPADLLGMARFPLKMLVGENEDYHRMVFASVRLVGPSGRIIVVGVPGQ